MNNEKKYAFIVIVLLSVFILALYFKLYFQLEEIDALKNRVKQFKVRLQKQKKECDIKISKLKNELEIRKYKIFLKKLKSEIKSEVNNDIEILIRKIISVKPEKIVEIYPENSHKIIEIIENIKNIYKNSRNNYENKIKDYLKIKREIDELNEKLKKISNADKQKEMIFIPIRKYDYDYNTGKSFYECYNILKYKVVLIAKDEDIKMLGLPIRLTVIPLGRKEVIVTNSDGFNKWTSVEFWEHYMVVSDDENIFLIKERIKMKQEELKNKENEILPIQKEFKIVLEEKIKPLIIQLLSLL